MAPFSRRGGDSGSGGSAAASEGGMGDRPPHGRIWSVGGHLGLNVTAKEALFSVLYSALPQSNFQKIDSLTVQGWGSRSVDFNGFWSFKFEQKAEDSDPLWEKGRPFPHRGAQRFQK